MMALESAMNPPPSVKRKISFVIPCLNEYDNLRTLLPSIGAALAPHDFEVIVADNGSTDGSQGLARSLGAAVLDLPNVTIGALRNRGSSVAEGEFLVFLDADMVLDHDWGAAVVRILSSQEFGRTILGSRPRPPGDASWVARTWFGSSKRPNESQVSHLGTGHMIVSKALFESLGGFDEGLATGEDYEFCVRAKNRGVGLRESNELGVTHRGVPRNLYEFFVREIWHGSSDFKSIRGILTSGSALAAIAVVVLQLAVAGMVITRHWVGAMLAISLVAAICVSSARRRRKGMRLDESASLAALFYVYYAGRFACMLQSTKLERLWRTRRNSKSVLDDTGGA